MATILKKLLSILFHLLLVLDHFDASVNALNPRYLADRKSLIEEEESDAFAENLVLEDDEIAANECLMAAKYREVNEGYRDPDRFLPAKPFLEVREKIKNTDVFKIIKKMPKGGVLHVHSSAMLTAKRIVDHLTYEANLYVCWDDVSTIKFKFFERKPHGRIKRECSSEWRLLEDERKRDGRWTVDERIKKHLKVAYDRYSNIDDTWKEFESIFRVVSGIIFYRPAFEKYFRLALEDFYADNVQFVEIRTGFSRLYELDGTQLDLLQVVSIYVKATDDFKKSHPDFVGTKVIYSVFRGFDDESVDQSIRDFKQAKQAFPDYILGFDFIGQEEKHHALLHYADKLEKLGEETQFFFHAGETNWWGTEADANLYDAILLNTKRIGHGNALVKHPRLMKLVKEKNIAIEVNPISNQALKLVDDFRTHPASSFFAENLPVVVSSDDPAFWDAVGLSHDFYEAFVGMMSKKQDLRALKQLALNSIEYSGLQERERRHALELFEKRWREFVRDVPNNPVCQKFVYDNSL